MSRTAMLLGREAVERLEQATVAVFGLGIGGAAWAAWDPTPPKPWPGPEWAA